MIKNKVENKSYGSIKAVNNLSFRVKDGELFSFLGINGAGKSTTINMICGELKKDSGTILVCDKEVDSDDKYIKRKIGVVFQESLLDKSLTVYDNLKIKASLYGITGNNFVKRYNELSKLFDLYEIEDNERHVFTCDKRANGSYPKGKSDVDERANE